ncbi:acetate--CoA ligase family protein [Bradyrhizobium sp. 48]|uniref:acetate--CoA ligase family protein n=1 Tax=Bradyrhizobium sp. 48 TaxID=2782676 RepID=UPI001FF85F7F
MQRSNDLAAASLDAAKLLLNPKSVAVIGASQNPDKVGGRPIAFLQRFGFKGEIYPVNPVRDTVQGLRCYKDILDIKAAPDAAIVAVDGRSAVEQIARCATAGVKAAVVMSAGFGELGVEGRQRELQMLACAEERGMRIVGPNAQGVANFANGAVLNFSTVFTDIEPKDGPIAIIGQSGAASVMPFALLREAGYGVRYVIATGNDIDLTACAMAEAVAADEQIRVILLYLESLQDPARLASAAAIARRRGAYLLVLKGGESRKGATAAASHTGALVGDDAAVDVFLARNGIYRARDVADLVRATALYLDNRPPGAARTVSVSYSGAVAVMTADLAERVGLELTDLNEVTTAALRKILPEIATPNNPLDMTAAILGNPEIFPAALNAMGDDPKADAVMVTIPVAGRGYDIDRFARSAADFARTRNKPVVASAAQSSVRRTFEANGVPTFSTEADAVLALRQYARHHELLRAPEPPPLPEPIDLNISGLLNEGDSLALLANHGIPIVRHVICRTPEDAAAAFRALGGGSVVVKGCAANVPHKSDLGLVYLRVATEEAAALAAHECLSSLRRIGTEDPKVIVAIMIRGGHEFALGVSVDPKLGPVVLIGDGGTLIELRKDVSSLLAPFTLEEAIEACMRLRLSPLFQGYRGAPSLNVQDLAGAAVALGDFATRSRTSLKSVDINPIILLPGGGAVAVDAVIEFK